MPKFFQVEQAAYGGQKNTFRNVKFKKNDLDSSNAAETGTILEIIPIHIKRPPVIQFIAYLDQLQDKFNSKQTSEQPFGRTDPYYIWKSNDRSITANFTIPSSGIANALDNLNNLSWFLGSLYPTYKDTVTATSLAASPMFRVRFGNLICSSTRDGQGLLGVIQSVSVTHDLKGGVIGFETENVGSSFANEAARLLKEAGFDNSIREGKKLMIPKFIKVSFTLNVVHDHSLGWDFNTGNWRGGLSAPRFPYDFGLIRDTSDSPGSGINESAAGAPPSSRASDEAAAAGGALLEVSDLGTNRDAGATKSTVTPPRNPMSNL